MGRIRKQNMTIMDPPLMKYNFPMEETLTMPSPELHKIMKNVDMRYFVEKKISFTPLEWESIWHGDSKDESLSVLAARQVSNFRLVFGKTNGRLHVTSAMENIYPNKYADAI